MQKIKNKIRILLITILAAGVIVAGAGIIAGREDMTEDILSAGKTGITGTKYGKEAIPAQDNIRREPEKTGNVTEICLDLYAEAARKEIWDDPETVREIVKRFGEHGYVSVDSENQIDMTCIGQVMSFCENAEAGKEDELTIIEVTYRGGFVRYDLLAREGGVNITGSAYEYQNGNMEITGQKEYPADHWEYTKEGYLMFSGSRFSEEMYVLVLDEAKEYAAFRVQPLDETCRELNREYLFPIGYKRNNMFLADWSEEDFGELDFYDMFEILYPRVNGQPFPYTADENMNVGTVYQIPEEVFENVIMAYFAVDSETLRSGTVYDPEKRAYEYKPRGFYESEYPEYPYPEVTAYTKNRDGTLTLTVNAVFPYKNTSRAYAHEVVIRPLADGGVQYVSNHVIPSKDKEEASWYTPRLTAKEWEEIYGGDAPGPDGPVGEYLTKPDGCLISEEEKERLQGEALSAAKQLGGIYKEAEPEAEPAYASGIRRFTAQQRRAAAEELGKYGHVSATENTNMQNPEKLKTFYAEYLSGKDTMATVFEIYRDGVIGATTFVYRHGALQAYFVGIRWKEGGVPEIEGAVEKDLAEIRLTEKGYFIYTYKETVAHTALRQYYRVEPLPDKCRELTEKYIAGLSYVNYNVLVTNWDSGNAEDILMPCMFEDIYRIDTGENLKAENGRIPAELYEKIMTTYFPVSAEQVRSRCGYDAGSSSYRYEMILGKQYPPFGEVVDHTENADGTITLTVDGVWIDFDSDHAFTNRIVVLPFADGTFRYLSNSIKEEEMTPPVITETGG